MIQSVIHFVNMGGYGTYVWSAYGIVLLGIAIAVMCIHIREKKLWGNRKDV